MDEQWSSCPLCDLPIGGWDRFAQINNMARHLLNMHAHYQLEPNGYKLVDGRDAVICWCGWVGRRRLIHVTENTQAFAEHLAAMGGPSVHILTLLFGDKQHGA